MFDVHIFIYTPGSSTRFSTLHYAHETTVDTDDLDVAKERAVEWAGEKEGVDWGTELAWLQVMKDYFYEKSPGGNAVLVCRRMREYKRHPSHNA